MQQPPAPPADDGFGDFDAAPAVAQPTPTAQTPKDALDAGAGLISLDTLSLNASAKAPAPSVAAKANYAQHSAFTGLDGFSTNPQPTMMASYGQQPAYQQQPTRPPMQQQQPAMMQQPAHMMGQPMMQQQAFAGGGYPAQQAYGYPPQQQQQQQPYGGMPGPSW